MTTHGLSIHLLALTIALLGTSTVKAGPMRKHVAPSKPSFVSLLSPQPEALQPEAIKTHPDLAKNADAAIRLMEALDVSPGF